MNTEAYKAAMEHDPKNPGKFEGEDKATVYYWHCMLDGDGESDSDEDTEASTVFNVEPDEKEAFGLSSPKYVIWETGDGFVYGREAD